MKNAKKQNKNLKIDRCRYCRKEYIDVGLFSDETLMVPDCDCQKVNSTMDRKMLASLMTYAKNGIFYSRLCDMLLNGKEYPVKDSNSMEWRKNFDYIQEIIEKQTGIEITEYDDIPPGVVKLYNLVKKEISPLEQDDITIGYIKAGDKKIQLPRWIKLHYKVSPRKVCKYCGHSYQERSILIGKTSFTYSVKPRCDCNKKIKISIHKGLVGYMLGALTLGKWTEGACANLSQGWTRVCDCRSERYGFLIDEIIDDIKTETGIEVESKGYGGCKEALVFIRNSIVDEVNRCDREEGFPVQDNWDFLREMKDTF